MKSAPLALTVLALICGCRSTQQTDPTPTVAPVAVQSQYYVLASELQYFDDGYMIWILALGDQPADPTSPGDQIILPNIPVKTRVFEDGYNQNVLERGHDLAIRARAAAAPIRFTGVPAHESALYLDGFAMNLTTFEANGVRIATDYGDHSHLRARTPRVLNGLYQGSRKLLKVARGLL